MYDYEADAPCDVCEMDTVQLVTVWAGGLIEMECRECHSAFTPGDGPDFLEPDAI
jgi:hypothetical protein